MILDWLNRYRHGRGFGIHSPFAFRFITEVLHEECPYYDFDEITDRRQRLIYRIACRFSPTEIKSVDGSDVTSVIKACPNARICDHGDWHLALSDTMNVNISYLFGKHEGLRLVIILDNERNKIEDIYRYMDGLGYGMTFDNQHDMFIIALDKKLPRQDFKVRF